MSIILQSSGGGSITVQEPATASNFTQTLPSVNGTIITTGNRPAGSVLQVFSVTKTDTFSTTSASDTAITGLSVSITPTSATSRILVIATFNFNTGDTFNARFNLYRNASLITAYRGDAAGSRAQAAISYRGLQGGQNQLNNFALGNMNYLDSPATTSAVTYQVYCNTNGTITVNRSIDDSNTGDGARTASTITVMEIAA